MAVRVIGNQVSVLLSDIGAALDYPLAEQVLDYLDIPVPDEDDLDQVLPVGDLSIFADLGLDEMDLAAICSRLDFDSEDDPWDHVEDAVESIAVRLGFGPGHGARARRRPRRLTGLPRDDRPTGYEASFEPAMRAALAEADAAPGDRGRAGWRGRPRRRRDGDRARAEPARGGRRPDGARGDRRDQGGRPRGRRLAARRPHARGDARAVHDVRGRDNRRPAEPAGLRRGGPAGGRGRLALGRRPRSAARRRFPR